MISFLSCRLFILFTMRKITLSLILVFILTSCNKVAEISVFNNSEVDRIGEMVEVCLCNLPEFNTDKIVVLDTAGKQVPYQILYKGSDKPQSMIFQVSLAAGKKVSFTVQEGVPDKYPSKTFARFVPERKDDFTWENDKIAFRIYGPALANENPSNGVDVWYKKTNKLIIDKWYKNDLARVASYHDDHGEGLDCYKVAHTLGAGACAPYIKDSLYVGNHYDRFKVLDNGPLQSSFIVYHDNIKVGDKMLKSETTIILNAGTNLNEVKVKYTGDIESFDLAAGIYLHDSIQNINSSVENGYIGYAENLISQGKVPVPSGRGFTGVIFPGGLKEVKNQYSHILGIADYKTSEEFRYFFGAGWSKWGFYSDQEWFSYLASQRTAIQQPLELKILL